MIETAFYYAQDLFFAFQVVGFVLAVKAIVFDRKEDPRFKGAKLIYRS